MNIGLSQLFAKQCREKSGSGSIPDSSAKIKQSEKFNKNTNSLQHVLLSVLFDCV